MKDNKVVSINPFRDNKESLIARNESLETQLAKKDEEIKELRQEIDFLKNDNLPTKKFGDNFNVLINKKESTIEQRKKFFKKILGQIWKKRKKILKLSNTNCIDLWGSEIRLPLLRLYSDCFVHKDLNNLYSPSAYFGGFLRRKYRYWKKLPSILAETNINTESFEKEVLENIKKSLE